MCAALEMWISSNLVSLVFCSHSVVTDPWCPGVGGAGVLGVGGVGGRMDPS